MKTLFKKIFTRQFCWFKVSAQNQTWTTLQDASDPLKTTTATSFIFHIQCCPRHLFTAKLLKLIPLEQWLFWNHSPLLWTEAPNCSWHVHKARSHSPHSAQWRSPSACAHAPDKGGCVQLRTMVCVDRRKGSLQAIDGVLLRLYPFSQAK